MYFSRLLSSYLRRARSLAWPSIKGKNANARNTDFLLLIGLQFATSSKGKQVISGQSRQQSSKNCNVFSDILIICRYERDAKKKSLYQSVTFVFANLETVGCEVYFPEEKMKNYFQKS